MCMNKGLIPLDDEQTLETEDGDITYSMKCMENSAKIMRLSLMAAAALLGIASV